MSDSQINFQTDPSAILEVATSRSATSAKRTLLPPAEVENPLWLSVSESAKFAGLGSKTIRRGIDGHHFIFKVNGNRYLINSHSLITWIFSHTKLRNKFLKHGFGQYVKEWKN